MFANSLALTIALALAPGGAPSTQSAGDAVIPVCEVVSIEQQSVEVVIQAPDPRDERTRELLKELARLNPEDPRSEVWSKV